MRQASGIFNLYDMICSLNISDYYSMLSISSATIPVITSELDNSSFKNSEIEQRLVGCLLGDG